MLRREATYFTPDLLLTDDLLHISGRLWMENPAKYFEKICIETRNCDSEQFTIILDVEFVNSSSIKQLLSYFKLLKQLQDEKKFEKVVVIWYVNQEDFDLLETVNDLNNVSELSIKISFKKQESAKLNKV